MSKYINEIAFLKRKLPTANITWDELAAMGQVISQPLADSDADNFFKQYKDMLGTKAGLRFDIIFSSVSSKLRGGKRIVVNVSKLREVFADEIDGFSGGGGKGLNPLRTNMSRGR